MTGHRRALAWGILAAGMWLGAGDLAADEQAFRVLMPHHYRSDALKISAEARDGYTNTLDVAHCPTLDDPKLAGSQRNTIELMFVCHSVRASGAAANLKIVPFPNPRRALTILLDADADAFGSSLFSTDVSGFEGRLLISDYVLSDTQFPLGLFTAPNRADVLASKTADDLLKLRGITVKHWSMDRLTMGNLPLAQVLTVGDPERIGKMIERGRADITFSFLNRATIEHMGIPLKRIDGFKVYLKGFRVLIFGRHRQNAFDALQAFIRESRAADDDPIVEAYYHSGFLAHDYDDWPALKVDLPKTPPARP